MERECVCTFMYGKRQHMKSIQNLQCIYLIWSDKLPLNRLSISADPFVYYISKIAAVRQPISTENQTT